MTDNPKHNNKPEPISVSADRVEHLAVEVQAITQLVARLERGLAMIGEDVLPATAVHHD